MVRTGTLKGLRVIDFGQYIAGPLAAMQLADHGADVIRVDPPGGPRWDTPANAMWNRGKRSIVLDLKQLENLDIARRLIATADVVIENFRPGVMTRLGLDAVLLSRDHPHLIWCSLPGFASDDPRAGVPAWEGVLGAATGNFTLDVQWLRDDAGRRRPQPPKEKPVYNHTPVSSVYAGCFGALSIVMALVSRQRDGRGQRIEVPLYDATFCAIGSPQWRGIPGTPWTRSYRCGDGRWVDLLCYHGKFIRAFLNEVGIEEWLDGEFIGNIERPFKQEPAKAAVLLAKMEALFKTRTALEWEDSMDRAGVPLAVCRTSAEWMQLPQAQLSDAIVELDDPTLGPMRVPGIQTRLSETPGRIAASAPLPDQHRGEILTELKSLRSKSLPLAPSPDTRTPLDGLRVIDLGTVLVGPACGRILAEFGADVIKIDDPKGIGPGVDVGRGKRSMFLDLRRADGRMILDRLADSCDIFLQNFRLGVAERIGIGFNQLRARNPGMVYISYTLYGRDGPWAGRPGYENQAQATTGMMERFGDGTPVMEPFPVSDYGTALTGTFGIALALYRRNQLRVEGEPPRGQHVDTALVYTACLLQSRVMNDYATKQWNEPRGQHALGSAALQRCYRASDGWLFLGATDSQLIVLDGVRGLNGIANVAEHERVGFLESRFADTTVDEWTSLLRAADIGAHAVVTVSDVMADPWARSKNLYLKRPHPDGGEAATIGPIPRFSQTPLVPGRPLRPSMDAPEILAELHLDKKLDDWLADGTIAIRPPKSKK